MRITITHPRIAPRRALAVVALATFAAASVDVAVAYYADPSAETGPELVWPAAPDAPRVRFVRGISSPADLGLKRSSAFKRIVRKIVGLADQDATLVAPYGITTDSRGRLIVVDPKGEAVHVYDVAGKKYTRITAPKNERFVSIVAVAVDDADNIYVADT